MSINRRQFIKLGSIFGLGASVAPSLHTKGGLSRGPEWRMLINTTLCLDSCDSCVTACHTENNVSESLRWIRKAKVVKLGKGGEVKVNAPILCNQCDNPPCALVCPVEATFQRSDKIVDVDKHRCIGCRYCVIGCPYDVRVFNFVENHKSIGDEGVNPVYPKRMHGVAESCNFCSHRVDKAVASGEEPVPACVEHCPTGAMVFGDISDSGSKISRYMEKVRADNVLLKGLREDLGTKPKVLYIGL